MIYASYSRPGVFTPYNESPRNDDGYVERTDVKFICDPCFAQWWHVYNEHQKIRITPKNTRVAHFHIANPGGSSMSRADKPILAVAQEACEFFRSIGLEMYVVASTKNGFKSAEETGGTFGRQPALAEIDTFTGVHYAFEYWLAEKDQNKSDFVFTYLNIMRLMTHEFTDDIALGDGDTFRDFFLKLFEGNNPTNGHFPITYDVKVFDNDNMYYRRDVGKNHKYLPTCDKVGAAAMYDFYMRWLPKNPPWRAAAISDEGEMASNIPASLWRTFYDKWIDSAGAVDGLPSIVDGEVDFGKIRAKLEAELKAREEREAREAKERRLAREREAERRRKLQEEADARAAEAARRAALELEAREREREQMRAAEAARQAKVAAALDQARAKQQRARNGYLNGDNWMPEFAVNAAVDD